MNVTSTGIAPDPTSTGSAGLSAADAARVRAAVELISTNDTGSVVAAALPALSPTERASLAAHSRLNHAALLVFPGSIGELHEGVAALGLRIERVNPSVVVRGRLCERYGLADLDVVIAHAAVRDRNGRPCSIEIFALITPPELAWIAVDEQAENHESHLALEVVEPDSVVLDGLSHLLTRRGRMSVDGGGYNVHEDATVLYFRGASGADPAHRRLELISRGHFPEALAEHVGRPQRAPEQLLRLMTGAWATQAIKVAAELRLPDRLAAGVGTVDRLALATGADADSLARLLRYLATLGVVRRSGPGFGLTEIGALLRSDVAGSLHPLALLYGGAFYESFGRLDEAVRTGRESFERVFGAHHFPYFAADPERADMFDRGMAASAAMFGELATALDFSAARVVVDVAGGNGVLLGKILQAHPHLRGVLLEREHVLDAARSTTDDAGCADRCTLVAGDFTETVPPGGDVYVLSRVLHDWDDTTCLTILRRCAESMPAHATLLVVERLLPEDDSDSLAAAWDVHMLCNVGGRERTESHYRALLAEAGFDLVDRKELALEAVALRAVKA
ncbi:acetylserotonin O-methyltransferase [Pseudonocardia sp. TRM90224]|uniref:acetylserotonin O-methyltransferase n=1 Tax=Pseudonocardia sp. TRM90224 TaxID=2812678 RepID=UPI001E518DC2|nr:acetylserotonin O-methyltransferase [Pseudonocardia sp. TRM90224]